MKRIATGAFLLALLARTAAAQEADRDLLKILGFNNACSMALAHYTYPKPATPMGQPEPLIARVGSVTISAGKHKAREDWLYYMGETDPWQPGQARDAEAILRAAGYSKPGFLENFIPPAPGSPAPPEEFFRLSAVPAPAGWRLAEIRYSPLLTCAFLVYRKEDSGKSLVHYGLERVQRPDILTRRGLARLAYADKLFDAGDIQAALEEAGIAARLAPGNAPIRYRRAALLCLNGFLPESLEELAAVLRLDKKLKGRARADGDFDSLFKDRRFKELTR